MRKQRHGWFRRRGLSLARIAALTGTLTLHIVVFAQLWLTARVVPQQRVRSAITVELYQRELPPPVEPAVVETPPATVAQQAAPEPPPVRIAAVALAPAPPTDEPTPAAAVADLSLGDRIDQQRTDIAAEIARENAPARRLFRGRSIDAMLPDGATGILPGFRPKVSEGTRGIARSLANMLGGGVPTAATDPDAPTDLLTEGWEAKHHGSDLAGCELQYQELDVDLRRQMCGEDGPGR